MVIFLPNNRIFLMIKIKIIIFDPILKWQKIWRIKINNLLQNLLNKFKKDYL